MTSKLTLKARWVLPVSGPPLERGIVEVEDGRITAVHDHHTTNVIDLGDVALIPGLINAHAHLEFSDLAQPVQPALPFTDWLGSLVAFRRSRPVTRDVLQQGLAECERAGAVAVGEIATQDWSDTNYRRGKVSVTVFRELIAPVPDRIAGQLELARKWLAEATAEGSVRRGLSPHAPYTVHPDLYRDLVRLAADYQAPLAIHLAETNGELQLLKDGTGEFAEMLKRFNAWDEQAIPRGARPLDYLRPLEVLSRGLVIHGNYLQAEDLDWLVQHPQVSVVYCPRTHHFFQHSPHPWQQMLSRGINVALGTDGRGSNPDLSVWNEMRFLAEHNARIDPAMILEMGTLAGARALGLEADLGSLDVGKLASIAVVPLPNESECGRDRLLFSSPAAKALDLPG